MREFTPAHAVCSMLGYPLQDGDGFAEVEIDGAAGVCNVVVPKLLRLFYRYAARQKRFAQGGNRFLAPTEWYTADNHLIFLANAQTNERCGFVVNTLYYEHPPVEKTVDGKSWQLVTDNLPFYLIFVLHLNAVYGGLDCRGYTTGHQLNKRSFDGWVFGGTADGMTAYSRRHQAVCVGNGILWAGGRTIGDLRAIERDLSVSLEIPDNNTMHRSRDSEANND